MDRGGDPGQASLLSRALASEWIPPGLFFIALGVAALWLSRDYPVGDLNRMGPGYFPRMLSVGMICLGVLIVRQGLPDLAGGKGIRNGLDRSIWLIPLSLVVFGLSVERLGFFFNDAPTTEIYTASQTLSLPGALPIAESQTRTVVS
jgi:hypothetical protein